MGKEGADINTVHGMGSLLWVLKLLNGPDGLADWISRCLNRESKTHPGYSPSEPQDLGAYRTSGMTHTLGKRPDVSWLRPKNHSDRRIHCAVLAAAARKKRPGKEYS